MNGRLKKKRKKQALILTAEKDRKDKLLWFGGLVQKLQRHSVKNAIKAWKDGVQRQSHSNMAANESK